MGRPRTPPLGGAGGGRWQRAVPLPSRSLSPDTASSEGKPTPRCCPSPSRGYRLFNDRPRRSSEKTHFFLPRHINYWGNPPRFQPLSPSRCFNGKLFRCVPAGVWSCFPPPPPGVLFAAIGARMGMEGGGRARVRRGDGGKGPGGPRGSP